MEQWHREGLGGRVLLECVVQQVNSDCAVVDGELDADIRYVILAEINVSLLSRQTQRELVAGQCADLQLGMLEVVESLRLQQDARHLLCVEIQTIGLHVVVSNKILASSCSDRHIQVGDVRIDLKGEHLPFVVHLLDCVNVSELYLAVEIDLILQLILNGLREDNAARQRVHYRLTEGGRYQIGQLTRLLVVL